MTQFQTPLPTPLAQPLEDRTAIGTVKVFAQDETRLGLLPVVRRRLTACGVQPVATVSDQFGSPVVLGGEFLNRYLLAFEATSILLLVAAVGGVVLGSRRPSPRIDEPDAFPPLREQPAELELQAAVMDAETGFPVTHVPREEERS